jgi:hypothetical protein
MGMQLDFMTLGMDLLRNRPHRIVLEMVTLLGLDEKSCLHAELAEGIEHETEPFGTAVDIAPHHRLGNRLPGLVRKRTADAEFGIDRDADTGAGNCCIHDIGCFRS